MDGPDSEDLVWPGDMDGTAREPDWVLEEATAVAEVGAMDDYNSLGKTFMF